MIATIIKSETSQNIHFSFQQRELPGQLIQKIQHSADGYWQYQFEHLSNRKSTFSWYLGCSSQQIIYSGSSPWSALTLLRLVQRYSFQALRESQEEGFKLLRQKAEAQEISPDQMMVALQRYEISSPSKIRKALRLKILSDLDTYLKMGSGEANFIAAPSIRTQLPLSGFDAKELLTEALARQKQWGQIRDKVPASNLTPVLNQEAYEKANLTETQRNQIQRLVQPGKTIAQISASTAKDLLEVSTAFAKLVSAGLVCLELPSRPEAPTVMFIDDSMLMLKQFQHIAKRLGYPVVACQRAESAISRILQVKPSTIFIDINMPEFSGFDLVKQIRQQPKIAEIPLVILTGEQKMSNKWKAKWSGCEFLIKPLSLATMDEFQIQLAEILQRLLQPSPATFA